jgi:hypothetical protein
MSVVAKKTQAGTFYGVIITGVVSLLGVGIFEERADSWGWGSFEGRLGDGHTSGLPQVDLHCRRRAVRDL